MSEEPDVATVAALLEDETVRTILTETSQEPMSASTLERRCSVSGPTIYRRLDRLREVGLIVEQTQPDADGHHRKVFAPTLERVTITMRDGSFEVSIDRREDMADRFTRLIEGI